MLLLTACGKKAENPSENAPENIVVSADETEQDHSTLTPAQTNPKPLSEAILGSWSVEDAELGPGSTFEFYEDGTLLMTRGDHRDTLPAEAWWSVDYEFITENTIQLSHGIWSPEPVTAQVSMPAADTLNLKIEYPDSTRSFVLRNPRPLSAPSEQPPEDAILGNWVMRYHNFDGSYQFTTDGYAILYIRSEDGDNLPTQTMIERYQFTEPNKIELTELYSDDVSRTTLVRIPTHNRLILQFIYDGYPDGALAFYRATADSANLQQAIVGQWQISENSRLGSLVHLEIFADGTVIQTGDKDIDVGNYEWIGDRLLNLTLDGQEMRFQVFVVDENKALLLLPEKPEGRGAVFIRQ
jgi:hypothetical protein